MSHQPERKEKDCLNCGAEVQGRYCGNCGQENIIPHQNFLSLTKHFIYDIFHFDGKFFDTLKYLLIRPGRVPREYILGRRTKYLDPIRMYLFTSALFFLIFFSTQKIREAFLDDEDRNMTKIERFEASAKLFAQEAKADTLRQKRLALLLDTTKTLRIKRLERNEKVEDSSYWIELDGKPYIIDPRTDTISVNIISSNDEEDNWFERRFEQKWKTYKRQYGDDTSTMMGDFSEKFLHWFPYILFVSLPFFALILKLLYTRRKQFFYSDHAVFTLYHYIFSFILLLLIMGFNALDDKTGFGIFGTISTLLIWSWFIYLFISLKRFYGQGWGKTFFKFLLLNTLGSAAFLFIFLCFTFLFIFQL